MEEQKSIIIIGAGMSGMYAASQLKKFGYNVKVLEATDYIGGRIKSETKLNNKQFSEWPVELGAEEVHGELTYYKELMEQSGAKLHLRDQKNDFITYKNNIIPLNQMKQQFPKEYEFIDELVDKYLDQDDTKKNCQQFINENEISQEFNHYFQFALGAECGTDMNNLGVRVAQTFGRFTAGDDNFILDKINQIDLINKQFYPKISQDVELNSPVSEIDYKSDKIKITTEDGRFYTCDQVIVTVPISQLQKKRIQFIPEFEQKKQCAIDEIGYDSGGKIFQQAKIFLKFKEQFWPQDMYQLILESKVCNAYWRPTANIFHDQPVYQVGGEQCRYLASMSKDDQIQTILNDLQKYFPNINIKDLFEDYYLMDWSNLKYFEGAYSFPIISEKKSSRKIAQEPILNKIYFAGEAYHSCIWATVPGAMETGELVVHNILYNDRKIPHDKEYESYEQDFKFETNQHLKIQ